MGKNPEPGFGMNIPNLFFLELTDNLVKFFWLSILEFFDADPDLGFVNPGSGINVPDSQHGQKFVFMIFYSIKGGLHFFTILP
jgi:hypothetical protein